MLGGLKLFPVAVAIACAAGLTPVASKTTALSTSNHVFSQTANSASNMTTNASLTPITDDNIVTAVTEWCAFPSKATATYGDISDWDTQDVTNMSYLFASPLNGVPGTCVTYDTISPDLSKWNVSRVVDMTGMFWMTHAFNSDLSAWDVSRCTNMSAMFNSAQSFTSDISQWDMRSVTNARSMFNHALKFNSDISGWNTGALEKMGYMFWGAVAFNYDLSSWDVSRVGDMRYLFYQASLFAQHLCWDIPENADTTLIFNSTAGACVDGTCGSVADSSLYC